MTRTVTALFDSVTTAERAAHELATRVGGVRGTIVGAQDADSLATLRLPQQDMAGLREHARRGGAVFHAEVPDEKFVAVCDVLESAGAQDFEAQETQWRTEGWNADHSAAGSAATGSAATGGTATAAAAMGAATRPISTGTEEHIPVVEEQLVVGKRETEHGRVRVRSYVVETPVQEQVTLHEEHVRVERRPVDRALGSADEDAFQERIIEATETAEEAVVDKQARVVEEVVVRKEADDRTRTISDTVRRTEVEIEDDRKPTPRNRR
ncbi:MAG: YsnF/AvaK domain-containing protein [Acetobacteraceae bacterium]|nr:YsnF/AvaK domain-containing protein [Acetobacteraceae bacterium]